MATTGGRGTLGMAHGAQDAGRAQDGEVGLDGALTAAERPGEVFDAGVDIQAVVVGDFREGHR